jgi:hypothetical protein
MGEATVGDLVVRLRATACRMVPFSETKTLLREAAVAIERLDGDARDRATEIARLTSELNKLRPAPRSA